MVRMSRASVTENADATEALLVWTAKQLANIYIYIHIQHIYTYIYIRHIELLYYCITTTDILRHILRHIYIHIYVCVYHILVYI